MNCNERKKNTKRKNIVGLSSLSFPLFEEIIERECLWYNILQRLYFQELNEKYRAVRKEY